MRNLFWLLILAFAYPASATIALVGCTTGQSGSSTTYTVTRTTSAGNLLTLSTKTSTSTATWTVADSGGTNTWTQSASGYQADDGSNIRADIRYVANAGATTSVTVTFNGTDVVNEGIECEWSGAALSSVEDTSVNKQGSGFVTTLTSGTYTTTDPNDLLVYVVSMTGAVTAPTAGSGFTIPANGTVDSRQSLQYNIVSSIQSSQTTSMSWTTSARAVGIFVAFKPPPTLSSGHKPIIIQ